MTATKTEKVDAAYTDAAMWVQHYLDEISGRLHDMPAPESDGLNWAHVGSMLKIKEDLREIVAFMESAQ